MLVLPPLTKSRSRFPLLHPMSSMRRDSSVRFLSGLRATRFRAIPKPQLKLFSLDLFRLYNIMVTQLNPFSEVLL